LSFDASPQDVENHFKECGGLTKVKVFRGRAFLKFDNKES
jgi:RNA recognition motif-containing protein